MNEKSCFQFNNIFYYKHEKTVMGSPISLFIAGYFMNTKTKSKKKMGILST